MRIPKILAVVGLLILSGGIVSNAQEIAFEFGERKDFNALINDVREAETLQWIDVNTTDTTWYRDGDKLVCKGLPIGVVRSEMMYQNFIMHVEWRHMEKGGNSGIFVWCDAQPEEHRCWSWIG
jgi:hypothetical protein